MIIVNNFYAYWNRGIIEETDIKTYGNDLQILPTTNIMEIYQYSDAIFQDMHKDALKSYEKFLLYSRKKVT